MSMDQGVSLDDLKTLLIFALLIASIIALSAYFNYYLPAIVIFGVMMLIFSASLFYGAPWFPAKREVVKKMVGMAGIKSNDVVYDLGSGDARILVEAAIRHNAKFIGVEINPFVYLISKVLTRQQGLKGKIKLIRKNLFNADLRDADVIFVFLMQGTNDRLEKKLKKELKKGSRIVSHVWKFRSLKLVKADEKLKVYSYKM